jgi:tetratricopeptide (TPR) repeat protein
MKSRSTQIMIIGVCLSLACCSCDQVRGKLYERRLQIAQKKYLKKDYAGALEDYSDAIRLAPHDSLGYLRRGNCKYELKNFVGAISDFSQAIALDPRAADGFLGRGTVKIQLHQLPAAIADLDKAVSLASWSASVYITRGHARQQAKDQEGAMLDFTKAIELGSHPPLGYLLRANLELQQREPDEALADANKAIESDSINFLGFLIRAGAEYELRDLSAALADADEAVKLGPQQAECYGIRGEIKLTLGNDFDGAGEDLRHMLNLNSNSEPALRLSARIRKKRGDLSGALADYTKAARVGPTPAGTYYGLGCVQSDSSQYAEALQSFRNALDGDTNLDYAWFRVWLTRARLGESTKATRELETHFDSLQGHKTQDWNGSIYRFLAGRISEEQFFGQAKTLARHPAEEPGQICESYYYAAMKRLFDNDKAGATELFQKCLDTKQDGYTEFSSARVELAALSKP